MKSLLTYALALLLITSVNAQNKSGAVPVTAGTIQAKKSVRVLNISGITGQQSKEDVYSLLPGNISEVKIKEGDKVRKGQLLALVKRTVAVFSNKPVEITAPIDGYIGKIYLAQGSYVDSESPLLSVIKIDTLLIDARLPVVDIDKVKVGMTALVSAPEVKDLTAVIHRIDPPISLSAVVVHIFLYLPNKGHKIRPDTIVSVRISTPSFGMLTIPSVSAYKNGGQTGVWKIVNGKVQWTAVEILGESSDSLAIKSPNVSPGDSIVVAGGDALSDGVKVMVKKKLGK
jgi:multidrug efflux pump subunit AcrA (membrane-fusion protein)